MIFRRGHIHLAGFLLAIVGLILAVNPQLYYAAANRTLSATLNLKSLPFDLIQFSWICLAVFFIGLGMMFEEALVGS